MGRRWDEEFPRRNLGGPVTLRWCPTCERWAADDLHDCASLNERSERRKGDE